MSNFDQKTEKSAADDCDVTLFKAGRDEEAVVDHVFGVVVEGAGPNYTNVGWIRASVLLMKAQVGLGVLGIPSVFDTLGMIPGVIVILTIAVMTTWSSYVVGTFKLKHPEVHSIADVGMIFWGPVGRECLGAIYFLYMICISGSGMLSVSISFNAMSDHGTCTVVFAIVAAIMVFALSSVRTLDRLSFLGWIGMVSILSACITLAVSVGVQSRPSAAPQTGPWSKDLVMFGSPSFADASSSLGTVVFAFAGTPAFFNVVAEMRRPGDFPKTVALCQSVVTAIYVTIGIVVYYYCGVYVASPALGSAGILLKKVCYGLALPALTIGAVIYCHLPAKYIFVRILRGSEHLTSNSARHWITWLSCVFCTTAAAFLIADGVPVFNGLISLVGALFGTIMSLQVMGGMWLFDNWQHRSTNKTLLYRFLVGWNIWLILAGSFITVAGSYGSIASIISTYAADPGASFSCSDNSS